MKSTFRSPSSLTGRPARHKAGRSPHPDRGRSRPERGRRRNRRVLGRYTDWEDSPREVIAQPGWGGSVLVVDRDVIDRGDPRLVAHLAADEPPENAVLVCDRYLEQARGGRCRCRLLMPEDCRTAPFTEGWEAELEATTVKPDAEAVDREGRTHRLELLQTGMTVPELRWCRHPPDEVEGSPTPVSVREATGCLESYQPVRTITLRALVLHRSDPEVSTTVLRAELERLQASPIVLNRRLRAAVLATIERQDLSMSEIAIRCGRIKRDCKNNESGETSWLARRLGILPEGGRTAPTPWIHSDVLALIARSGLGVSPREVEMG
jgi:hypothetical protein